jgi:ABC-2 type transport system permease protein
VADAPAPPGPAVYLRLAGAAARALARSPGWALLRTLTSGGIQLLELLAFAYAVGRFGGVAGWGAYEVALLGGLGMAGLGLAQMAGEALDEVRFAQLVRRGTLDQLLTRPVAPLPYLLANGWDPRFVGRVAMGVGLALWAGSRAGVTWTPAALGLVAVAVVACAAILLAVFVVGAAVTLVTIEGSELLNIFTFGAVGVVAWPLEVYGPALRFVVTWVVPLGVAVYLPGSVLLGRAAQGIGWWVPVLVPLAVLGSWAVALLAWRAGLRRYVGSGS